MMPEPLLGVEVVFDLLWAEVGDEISVLRNLCLTVFHEYIERFAYRSIALCVIKKKITHHDIASHLNKTTRHEIMILGVIYTHHCLNSISILLSHELKGCLYRLILRNNLLSLLVLDPVVTWRIAATT